MKVNIMLQVLFPFCHLRVGRFYIQPYFTDEKEYRSVILWLEDQKIRHYKIEERDGLRNIEKDGWKEAFNTYQRDLVSPVAEGTPNEQLNWLLSYAVRLEYADNGM